MRRYQVERHVRYGPEDVYAFDDELLEQMDDGPDRPRGLRNVRWTAALRRAAEVMGAPKIAPGIQLHVGARSLLAALFFAAARLGYDDVWTRHQLEVMRLKGLAGVAARLKRGGDVDAALALEGVINTQSWAEWRFSAQPWRRSRGRVEERGYLRRCSAVTTGRSERTTQVAKWPEVQRTWRARALSATTPVTSTVSARLDPKGVSPRAVLALEVRRDAEPVRRPGRPAPAADLPPRDFAHARLANHGRTGRRRFLHVVGKPAHGDRNGTMLLMYAMQRSRVTSSSW